jgi:hypothetical protein
MEGAPRTIFELPDKGKKPEGKERPRAERGFSSDAIILESFSPAERAEILRKQKLLSSLAYFIGKDFNIPVELNPPGEGWHWDFANNIIRIDPKDLLEKPLDYLRFVISHEGGHRRISRTEFIPEEEWRQPGFSFMMNAIEDPRDNNFVEENYPRFRSQMELAYDLQFDEQRQAAEKAKEKVGRVPRFIEAGFGYIRQWYAEKTGKEIPVPENVPDEVAEVVAKTVDAARESWWVYPSREEADRSEELIRRYAEASYKINKEKVWPEFKKLVDMDREDQKVQKLLQDMKSKQERQQDQEGEKDESGSGPSLPQELKDQLTPEQQRELEDAIKRSLEEQKEKRDKEESDGEQDSKQAEEAKGPEEEKEESDGGETKEQTGQGSESQSSESSKQKPIDLDSLSPELVSKLKEYIDSLPEEERQELQERAEVALKELEEELNETLEGKLSSNPEKQKAGQASVSAGERVVTGPVRESAAKLGNRVFSEIVAEVSKDANEYERYRQEVLPLIEKLEAELRQIFVARRITKWKDGYQTGKRIDIKKRIQEKAKEVPAIESRAWQKRELPKEKDYAISLLVDISGSMFWDNKSKESLKSIIVLAEVLNRLGINVEVLGFNDEMREYQSFGEDMSKTVREHIGEIMQDAERKRCNVCKSDHNATDIGWATDVAAERLAKQNAEHKILITLSDYQLEESPKHPANKYEIGKVVQKISEETDVRLIGLGIGQGTEHASSYYDASITDVDAENMAEQLADLIREVIVNYDKF